MLLKESDIIYYGDTWKIFVGLWLYDDADGDWLAVKPHAWDNFLSGLWLSECSWFLVSPNRSVHSVGEWVREREQEWSYPAWSHHFSMVSPLIKNYLSEYPPKSRSWADLMKTWSTNHLCPAPACVLLPQLEPKSFILILKHLFLLSLTFWMKSVVQSQVQSMQQSDWSE